MKTVQEKYESEMISNMRTFKLQKQTEKFSTTVAHTIRSFQLYYRNEK